MKTHLITALLALSFLFALSSCDDEELKTEGEVNAEKIEQLVNERNLTVVTIYQWEIDLYYDAARSEWEETVYEKSFNLDSPFILVNNDDYYNLARLEKFSYENNKLILYLK